MEYTPFSGFFIRMIALDMIVETSEKIIDWTFFLLEQHRLFRYFLFLIWITNTNTTYYYRGRTMSRKGKSWPIFLRFRSLA